MCNFRGQRPDHTPTVSRNQIKISSKLYSTVSYTKYKHIAWMMHVRMEHNSGRSMINMNSFLAPWSWESALHLV